MSSRSAPLLVLLCLSLLPVFAQESPNPDPNYVRGVQLQKQGKTEEAVRAYLAALTDEPDNAAALSNLGAAYSQLGRYADAIEQYRHALTLYPNEPAIEFNLGLAYYKAARTADAARSFQNVLQLLPGSDARRQKAVFLLADCYSRLDENKKVVALLKPLESQFGDDHLFLYLYGTALIRDGQIEEGSQLVDRILRNGESAEAHLMLGTAAFLNQDFGRAAQEFGRAVQLNTALPTAHRLYGRALLSSGDPENAYQQFQRELALDPNDYESNLYSAVILRQRYDYQAALKYLQHALELRPGAPEARYQIASVDLATGHALEARPMLEALVKENPNFTEAHVSLASTYYRLQMKAAGDAERTIVERLNVQEQKRAIQAREKSSITITPPPKPPKGTP